MNDTKNKKPYIFVYIKSDYQHVYKMKQIIYDLGNYYNFVMFSIPKEINPAQHKFKDLLLKYDIEFSEIMYHKTENFRYVINMFQKNLLKKLKNKSIEYSLKYLLKIMGNNLTGFIILRDEDKYFKTNNYFIKSINKIVDKTKYYVSEIVT